MLASAPFTTASGGKEEEGLMGFVLNLPPSPPTCDWGDEGLFGGA